MTVNDILKRMERCSCATMVDALNVILRQEAEIERWRKNYDKAMDNLKAVLAERADHSEVITEFGERLKEKAKMGKGYLGNVYHSVDVCYIDQIAKELKGEQE